MLPFNLQKVGNIFYIKNIEEYITIVNRYPILTYIEEKNIAEEVYLTRDSTAAKILILCNLRFVIYIVYQYRGYGLHKSDLIQEGNIGLIKAIRRFNPTLGVKLISFAVYWIRAVIHEFILKNWRIVKIATTKTQIKLFFNLRKNKHCIGGWLKYNEVDELSNKLGVACKYIKDMELRMGRNDIYLEQYLFKDNNNKDIYPNELYLEDKYSNFANNIEKYNLSNYQKKILHIYLNKLDIRSSQIIQYRWLTPRKMTLHQLSMMYGISTERVRQLEQIAINKLKQSIKYSFTDE